MKRSLYLFATIFALTFVLMPELLEVHLQADQVIMLDVMFFDPAKSDFILDQKDREAEVDKAIKTLKGNVWGIFEEENALGGTALGAPHNVPDKPPWFWFDGLGDPNFQPGDNYLMLSCRESGIPPNVNLIDVISIRNDGNKPSDEEAENLLAEQYKGIHSPIENVPEAVSPSDKLTTTWGQLKREY